MLSPVGTASPYRPDPLGRIGGGGGGPPVGPSRGSIGGRGFGAGELDRAQRSRAGKRFRFGMKGSALCIALAVPGLANSIFGENSTLGGAAGGAALGGAGASFLGLGPAGVAAGIGVGAVTGAAKADIARSNAIAQKTIKRNHRRFR